MSEDEILLTYILQCKPLDLIIHKPVLTPDQKKQFEEYKCRRQKGEPLQYIIGSWDFMGLELMVNPFVLVPRPETEQLVEEALKGFNGGKVLDLGTGSGNIAIAIAKFCPSAHITTIDISPEAIAVAKANAEHHGVEEQIHFVHSDIKKPGTQLGFLELLKSKPNYVPGFDLIISNPPYIPTAQIGHLPKDVQQEPRLALDGGADGLEFYREIIKNTPHLLSRGGCLMMEFGDEQALSIKAMLDANFEIEIFKDLTGKERFLKARII